MPIATIAVFALENLEITLKFSTIKICFGTLKSAQTGLKIYVDQKQQHCHYQADLPFICGISFKPLKQ